MSHLVTGLLLGVIVGLLLAASTLSGSPMRPVPSCYEDQVLVGTGDFEDGRWDAYWCGPAVDDYKGDK
jgi:hypothetical protein